MYGHQTGKCCKSLYVVWDIPVQNRPNNELSILLIGCERRNAFINKVQVSMSSFQNCCNILIKCTLRRWGDKTL